MTTVLHGHDESGTTVNRPTNADEGFKYFDTDLGQLIVWDGSAWALPGGGSPAGQGAVNGATVSADEQADGVLRRTVLTLTATPVEVVSVTTGNGVGGTKIYDMPAGHINVLGCVAELTIAVPTADQADFTDATPEGQVGIGTLAPANADALGTDATDDNLGTAADLTMSAYSAPSVNIAPDSAGQIFNGTSTPVPVFANVFIDAADIDDGVTTSVELTGTVTITWVNLGDVT